MSQIINSETLTIGRSLRVLSRYAPLAYNILTIILAENGIPVTQVSFSRRDLEVLIDAPNAELLTKKIASIKTAPKKIYDAKVLYNNFNKIDWSVRPYYELALFDPNKPLYWDLGARLKSKIKLKPGLSISGTVDVPIYTNFDEIWRGVKGNLPHVRTDDKNYLNNTDPKIRDLLITSIFKLDSNLYGRLEVGYFEPSYAGLSSEILYFPLNHNFSIGAELNYSKSRDYKQL